MKVKVRQYANRKEATVEELAADYKFKGLNKYEAWDALIIDKGLNPGIDAKKFYDVFKMSAPCDLNKIIELDYTPTHMDTLLNVQCQVTEEDNGVHRILWPHGSYGSHPPCDTEFDKRFLRL